MVTSTKSQKPNPHMSVSNDSELAYAVDLIEGTLQSITEYLQKNPKKNFRIQFSRLQKFHMSAIKERLSWISSRRMAQKIASQFVYIEFLKWMERHSNLKKLERSLMCKDIIVFSASVTEALVNIACNEYNLNHDKYLERVNDLKFHGFVSEKLCQKIKDQWILRGRVHLAISTEPEDYSLKDANASFKTTVESFISINEKFEELHAYQMKLKTAPKNGIVRMASSE